MKPATLVSVLVLASSIVAPLASAQATLDPQLVEVQPDPGEQGPGGEWVEIANPSPLPADLDGLYLTDYDPCFAPGQGFVEEYRWPLEATVPARGLLVLELPDNCLTLADRGDEIALEDEEGNVLEHVAYGDEGELPEPDPGESLAACHEAAHQYEGWDVHPVTPGRTNPRCPQGSGLSPLTPWQ